MIFEPFLGLFAGMFRIIVLLKDDVLRRFARVSKAFLKLIVRETLRVCGNHTD
jgi:hypothetical protein